MRLFSRLVRRTKRTVESAINEIIEDTFDDVEQSIKEVLNRTVIARIYSLTRKALKKIQKVKDLAEMTQEEILKEIKSRIWDQIDDLVPDAREIENYIDKIIIDSINTHLQ